MRSAPLAVRRVQARLFGAGPAMPDPQGDFPARTTARLSVADLAMAARARFAGMDKPEKLVPVGVCALLLAAALVSALPPAGAATAHGTWSQYGMATDGAGSQDTQVPPDDRPAIYAPELAIVNTLQKPVEIAQSRVGFIWYDAQSGDSLKGIAARFNIKIETLYFANQSSLPNSLSIHAGLRLLVPPMDGAIVVVADGETLLDIANTYQISGVSIMEANALTSPTLVAGQMLVVPGAYPGNLPGAPGANGGTKYVGGRFWWPVNGPWRASQGFWSEHRAIDIAAAYGTPVVAAAGGKVVYAGWKSKEQGGNVIWIQHAGGLYTTYNHLSKWSVRYGQTVRAGQTIGEIGTSGVSSGPHLHFEVWVGYPWHDKTNASAVNPCRYLVHC